MLAFAPVVKPCASRIVSQCENKHFQQSSLELCERQHDVVLMNKELPGHHENELVKGSHGQKKKREIY